MSDDFLDYINAEMSQVSATPDRLTRVRAMAEQVRQLEQTREELEERLSDIKNRLRILLERDLVKLMGECNMSSFVLDTDGNNPPLQFDKMTFYSAKIPEDKEMEAFQWFHDNGHGDLVKTEIKLSFGMNERDQAEKLERALADKHYDYNSKLSVHAATLKSFVKSEVEAGRAIPLDLLGAYVGETVKLKKGKA